MPEGIPRRAVVSWCSLCLLASPSVLHAQTPPSVDHPSGLYQSAFNLVLSSTVNPARIFYTTNGTVPTPTNGVLYDRPIPVTTTTILRAAAWEDGSDRRPLVISRTYLFLRDVLAQTGALFPETWSTNRDLTLSAHYRMSAGTNAAARARVLESLASLPSLSIITEPQDLFSPDTGIYTHPMERGRDWERAAAVELLEPQGAHSFQIECGLRVHGGMSRHPDESPKHSFRLLFRRRFGAAKLQVPLFASGGAQAFSSLVLRAGNNDSWLASDGQTRRQADYLRDEWMRRSLLAMGYPSARGIFVHLYLDGLYWGLYNLCEYPEPSWLADPNGRSELDYDLRKGDKTESGDDTAWNQTMALANSGLSDSRAYQAISRQVDLAQLADFLVLNFYAGNTDWDRSANWYAYRPRLPGGTFRFLVWDAECVLHSPVVNTLDFEDDDSPPRLFQKLLENVDFRTLFAERAQRLLFNHGPLTPEAASARYRALVESVEKAIPAEACRWGAYRRDLHPYKTGPFDRYTPESHWQPEVHRILEEFFPLRREVLLNQFRERGLFNSPER